MSAVTPRSGNRSPVSRIVFWVSWLNLLTVVILAVLLLVVSEEWWLSLAMSYLPRVPYLVPSILLGVASLCVRPKLIGVNLLSALIIAGPIMGFRTALSAVAAHENRAPITVLSYNVQGGEGRIENCLAEIKAVDPDVIVLQEAARGVQPIKDHYIDADFNSVHAGEYLVISRWPVRMKDVCRVRAFNRVTGIICEVEHPTQSFFVCDIHLTTARNGLAKLTPDSPLSGEGVADLDVRQSLRDAEALETRGFVADLGLDTPVLAVGDFNMPTSSSLFQKYWSHFTSAFDAAGWGYGYTSPCNTRGNSWPANTPWLRIDHILASRQWEVESSWIGTSAASDHRYIAAKLWLR